VLVCIQVFCKKTLFNIDIVGYYYGVFGQLFKSQVIIWSLIMLKEKLFLFAVLCLLFSASAFASYPGLPSRYDYVWNAATADWNDGANWDHYCHDEENEVFYIVTGDLPGEFFPSDAAYLDNGGTINITATPTYLPYVIQVGYTTTGNIINHSAGSMSGGYLYVVSLGNGDGYGGTYNLSGTAILKAYLKVGSVAGSVGTMNVTGGTYETLSYLSVGYSGTGIFTQTGGTVKAGVINIGKNATGVGTYNFNGGTLQARYSDLDVKVGVDGTGIFNQNVSYVGTGLWVGENAGSNGTYNFNADALEMGTAVIGGGGTGVFEHYSGTIDFTATGNAYDGLATSLIVGVESGSNGTYNLDSGSNLNVTGDYVDVVIGNASGSTGVLNIANGATMTVSGDYVNFIVENEAGANGAINIAAGGALSITGDRSKLILANGAGTSVTMDILTGTTLTISGNFGELFIANGENSTGILNIDGGDIAMSSAGFLIIGGADGSVGVVNHDSGSFGPTATHDPAIYLGEAVGSAGTYNHNGGTLSAKIFVGKSGTGYFNQNGTDVESQFLPLGYEEGGVGTYTMTAGSDLVVGEELIVGYEGQGTFNQTDSTVQADNLYIGYNNDQYGNHNGQGVYNMTGGTLDVTGELIVGRNETALTDAVFNQVGGDVAISGWTDTEGAKRDGDLRVGNYYTGGFANTYAGSGTYNLMNGGTIDVAGELSLGALDTGNNTADGILNTSDGSFISAGEGVIVGANSYIADGTTCSSATIETWGSFNSISTLNTEFDMTHTTLIMAWGGFGWDPQGGPEGAWGEWDQTIIRMGNVVDMSDSLAGLTDNFAVGNLVFSGSTTSSLWYRLESDIYCYGLSIEEGAGVDLNGYNIYYMPEGSEEYGGICASTFQLNGYVYNGWQISSLQQPGKLIAIGSLPEPGTIILIGAGVLGLAGIIRKRVA